MITPGQINLELLINYPLLYYGALLAASTVAGLLRGKKESDDAKNGTGDKSKENLTILDWTEDAGYGLIGGFIFLGTVQLMPIPLEFMPTFGYAGRMLLINWGKKAEQTSEQQPK